MVFQAEALSLMGEASSDTALLVPARTGILLCQETAHIPGTATCALCCEAGWLVDHGVLLGRQEGLQIPSLCFHGHQHPARQRRLGTIHLQIEPKPGDRQHFEGPLLRLLALLFRAPRRTLQRSQQVEPLLARALRPGEPSSTRKPTRSVAKRPLKLSVPNLAEEGLRMPRKRRGKTLPQAQPAGTERAPPGSGAEDSGGSPPQEGASPLQGELELVCRELERLRGRRAQLRAQHELLEQEAQQLRAESREFLDYVAKRAQRREGAAVSLGDESQQLLAQIQREHRELLARSAEQEAVLRAEVLRQEAELARLRTELEELRGVRALQQEQAGRVRELQRAQAAARKEHVQRRQEAAARFAQAKAAQEREARERAARVAGEAHQVAARCLLEHSREAQRQNRELRQELARLVARARALQAHKSRLEDHVQRLRRQHESLRDLALLRRGESDRQQGRAEKQEGGRPFPEAQGRRAASRPAAQLLRR
nr:coiled-coil domain-containing protein 166-like [Zootoca vivipara]